MCAMAKRKAPIRVQANLGGPAALAIVAVLTLSDVPALGQLAVLAALLAALIASESVHYARERDDLRHHHESAE